MQKTGFYRFTGYGENSILFLSNSPYSITPKNHFLYILNTILYKKPGFTG